MEATLERRVELTQGQKEELARRVGSKLHDTWRDTYQLNEDGTYRPKWKPFNNPDLEYIKNAPNPEFVRESIDNPGTYEIDIANLSFEKLPREKQDDNRKAGEEVASLINMAIMFGDLDDFNPDAENNFELMTELIHDRWLQRQKDSGSKIDPSQNVHYRELGEVDKEKDRDHLRIGLKIAKEMELL